MLKRLFKYAAYVALGVKFCSKDKTIKILQKRKTTNHLSVITLR